MSQRRRQGHAIHLQLVSAAFVLLAASHTNAQDSGSSNCHFTVEGLNYDLSTLGGAKAITRTRESPPTTYVDELRFDMCAELQQVDGRAQEDQCPSGTRACLTTTNQKGGNSDRITSVVPVAQMSSTDVETSALSSPEGITITFHGSSYPPSSSSAIAQSFKMSLTCAQSTADPQFVSYENGQVAVEWSTPVACRSTEPPKDGDSSGGGGKEEDTPIESVGSGLGFFFMMLLMAFAAYFALGAYYNYSTYGARGWDLIPHRDFWREVPYMLQDVVAHLCSNARMQRSSRGGYIAV